MRTIKIIKPHQLNEEFEECKNWLEIKYNGIDQNEEWKKIGLNDIYFSLCGFGIIFYSDPKFRLNLIHELTHIIQFLQKRRFCDLESIMNGLVYMTVIYPFLRPDLISFIERKRQEEENEILRKE
ncbi:MAG: hypothetical protein HQ521_06115 [Bacteroidetes bacterium]|nr:hypothetical protein [Bacteroidota bacterium]